MGLQIAAEGDVSSLCQDWPHRDQQIHALATLLTGCGTHTPTIIVHGPKSTGKSSIVAAVLEQQELRHTLVSCRECVTGRHLIEKIVANVHKAIRQIAAHDDSPPISGSCENLASLMITLEKLTSSVNEFILVLDGIDYQREAQPTLLSALVRLGSMVPKLCIILTLINSPPRTFSRPGLPHIYFAPYTRHQAIQILSRDPPDIFHDNLPDSSDHDEEIHQEDKAWLWPRFCAAVWDALAQNSGRDLSTYRELCNKLWRPFVGPIIKGDFGTRDFSKLMVAQSRLFQDESIQIDSILPSQQKPPVSTIQNHELPYHTKWLLIAAYLASFNPIKTDATYFMKTSERKRRRRGGGGARSGSRSSQTRKTPRHLLNPIAFSLDRLMSILHAILPEELRTSMDMQTQVATLSNLRLLVRTVGLGSADSLEPGAKWRVGLVVTWEYAQSLARSVDFDLQDYAAE